jgi:flagellar protein FlaI
VVTTTELVGLDPRTNELITNDVFKYSATEDENKYSGRSYLLEKIAKVNGKSVKEINEEVEKRKIVLDWMVKRNIRDFKEVSEIIRNFYLNPQDVIRLTRVG